jgi:hypothetical protein
LAEPRKGALFNRSSELTGDGRRVARRPGPAFFVSVVLHIVLGAALLRVLLMPHPFSNWLKTNHGAAPPVERIGFIALPKAGTETVVGKSGGNNKPITKKAPPKQLVAPTSVPNSISTEPAQPAEQEAGTGPVVGVGGATEGVRPQFSDPRVWSAAPSANGVTAPKSTAEQAQSELSEAITRHNDSLSLIFNGRKPGDWTFEGKNGERWGIDQKAIRLGPVSIPNAVLALLPLNHLGENPSMGQREAQLNAMHQDILEGASRQMNEDQFRQAVRETRQRKEREHQQQALDQLRLKQMPQQPSEPTIASPGTPPPSSDGGVQ